MTPIFRWDLEKNRGLFENRGITFDEIVAMLNTGTQPVSYEHPNQSKYPGQRIFEIEIKEYVWLVPYVDRDGEVFLKTAIPSRKATKRRRKT